MKRKLQCVIQCAVLLVCGSVFGYSNPIEGGATETVTNEWNVLVPWLMVGSNSGSNSLVVTESGRVNNAIGYLGNTTASSQNSALVTGSGAEWNNASELSVGYQGADNTLTVANGGRVTAPNTYVGNISDGNELVVTDSGSQLTATTLNVGHQGSDNTMTVSSGGRVESADGTVGYWIGSDNNTATVQGAGSVWSNSGTLNVGDYGAGNQLAVTDGGRVESATVNVGARITSSNNTVSVTGSGASLETDALYIGGSVSGAGGTGNLVEVGSGGTLYTEALGIYDGNNLDLNDGGHLFVNNDFNASTNGFTWNDGGHLSISGTLTGMPETNLFSSYTVSLVDGTEKTLTLDGGDWTSTSTSIDIGSSGANNTLAIINGGAVYGNGGHIGRYSGSDNNSVRVSGSGSLWSNALTVAVGNEGAGNTLIIDNGGMVSSTYGYVGSVEGSDSNSVVIDGPGSSWSIEGDFIFGREGAANTLVVSNGGRLESGITRIGDDWTADYNSVLVSGNGSVWSNRSYLQVGQFGSGNTLTIEDGARVENTWGSVGTHYDAGNNSAMVTGMDSVWANSGDLYVGYGYSNTLDISNGGRVENLDGYIGYTYLASNNQVRVSGAQSVWTNAGSLTVGYTADNNSMTIENGGHVVSQEGFIGIKQSSWAGDHNAVLVSGGGSRWQNYEGLYIGGHYDGPGLVNGGTGNSLTIADGGWVVVGDADTGNLPLAAGAGGIAIGNSSGDAEMLVANGSLVESGSGFIGAEAGKSGSATVTGSDSAWHNAQGLYLGVYSDGANWVDGGSGNGLTVADGGWVLVGDVDATDIPTAYRSIGGISVSGEGTSGELVISNGSSVESGYGLLGMEAGRSGSVTVSGSVWSNSSDLVVGFESTDNALSVMDGGTVYSANGIIGRDAGSNAVDLSGSGSTWISTGNVSVGYKGSDNVLTITGGASVESDGGYIGDSVSDASGNEVTVSGAGSVWNISDELVVGNYGSDNRMMVSGGGSVASGDGYIGYDRDASGNQVQVAGSGSAWTASGDLTVGFRGSDNILTIESDGSVQSQMGVVGLYSSGNMVSVSGSGSAWNNTSGLYVGAEGTDNQLTISGGGSVVSDYGYIGRAKSAAGNTVVVEGAGSSWDTGNLFVGDQGSANALVVTNGGSVSSENGAVGAAASASGNTILVSGSGSVWNNSEDLYLGVRAADNTLTVTDGGLVQNDDGYLGRDAGADGNQVSVTGAGSQWINRDSLYLGGSMDSTWTDGGMGGMLYVADGGLVSVGDNLHNRNYTTLNLDPGGQVTVGSDYYQDATSRLRFGVETNAAGAPVNAMILVGGTAQFEAGAQIEYASNVGQLQFDRFYTNKLVEADALIVAGISNPDSLDLEQLDASGSLVDVIFWENDQDIYALAGRKYLADSAGFAAGTMMANLAKEIDDMSLLGNTNANTMINLLNTMSGSQQNAQLTQLYGQGAPTYLHNQGMTEGLGELSKHTSRRTEQTPEGAAGPHQADQGPRGWIKPYGSWGEYSARDGFSGYDHNVYGTIVGIDWVRGDVLLGFAGGYARSVIDQSNGDSSEARTGYGVGYVSLGTDDWFGDVNVAVGRSDVSDESGTAFGAASEYDANNFAVYVGGGKEIWSKQGLFCLTPEASLLLSDYYQDAHEETGVLPRNIYDYDRTSIISGLGATLAMQKAYDIMILKPEARLRWLHDFNADPETVDYSLAGGSGIYQYAMPAAEEDVIETGLGLTCMFHDELSLGVDIDWRFGEDYDAYAASGRIILEF